MDVQASPAELPELNEFLGTFQVRFRRPEGRVVYLDPTDKCDRPLPSHLQGVNQTVIAAQIRRVAELGSIRFTILEDAPATHRLTILISPTPYNPWGCGHGGTR